MHVSPQDFLSQFKVTHNRNRPLASQPDWWDSECECLKAEKYDVLQQYRKTGDHKILDAFLDKKKQFKSLCQEKKEELKEKKLQTLRNTRNTSDLSKLLKMGTF